MNKIIILTIIFLSHSCVFAQDKYELPIDNEGNIVYTGIVYNMGMSKDDGYSKIREWAVKKFYPFDFFESNGKIIGIGSVQITNISEYRHIHTGHEGFITFMIEIWVKNDKYKYKIWNIKHKGLLASCGNKLANKKWGIFFPKKTMSQLRAQTHEKINLMIDSLYRSVTSNDEW